MFGLPRLVLAVVLAVASIFLPVVVSADAPALPTSPFGDIPAFIQRDDSLRGYLERFEQDFARLQRSFEDAVERSDNPAVANTLTEMHALMVTFEHRLLGYLQPIRQNLDFLRVTDRAYLLEGTDGTTVTAMTANQARDQFGGQFDAAMASGMLAMLPNLSDSQRQFIAESPPNSLAIFGIRTKWVNVMEDALAARQPALVENHRRDANDIEGALSDVRSLAAQILVLRNQIADSVEDQGVIRNDPGGANAAICLNQAFPMTGIARLVGFGVGDETEYPARGNYICDGDSSFWWVDGVVMRHFVCSSVSACRENLAIGFHSRPHNDGSTRLMMENGAMVILRRAQ